MTLNLPAGAMTDAATISPLALFLQADIVVKFAAAVVERERRMA